MKIIDAHIHFADHHGFTATARAAGHENTPEHLAEAFVRNHVELAIAMGTGRGGGDDAEAVLPGVPNLGGEFDPVHYNQPAFIAYCAGVDSTHLNAGNRTKTLEAFERHLQTPACVGIKLYPGYHYCYVSDPIHQPFFELARAYDVPVVIHTGDTAGVRGLVKYAHPLTVDEAALNFPEVRIVMAHYGNPWIVDATEVAAKNENVFIDLSGLAVGDFSADEFCRKLHGYLDHLRTWMAYLGDYEKFLYGSDWPLANLDAYIEVIRHLVPAEFHEQVFRRNALRVFPKLEKLLPRP